MSFEIHKAYSVHCIIKSDYEKERASVLNSSGYHENEIGSDAG